MDLLNLATSRRFAEKLISQLSRTEAVHEVCTLSEMPEIGNPYKIYVVPFYDARGRKCHNNYIWFNDEYWLLINTTVEGGELDLYVN